MQFSLRTILISVGAIAGLFATCQWLIQMPSPTKVIIADCLVACVALSFLFMAYRNRRSLKVCWLLLALLLVGGRLLQADRIKPDFMPNVFDRFADRVLITDSLYLPGAPGSVEYRRTNWEYGYVLRATRDVNGLPTQQDFLLPEQAFAAGIDIANVRPMLDVESFRHISRDVLSMIAGLSLGLCLIALRGLPGFRKHLDEPSHSLKKGLRGSTNGQPTIPNR